MVKNGGVGLVRAGGDVSWAESTPHVPSPLRYPSRHPSVTPHIPLRYHTHVPLRYHSRPHPLFLRAVRGGAVCGGPGDAAAAGPGPAPPDDPRQRDRQQVGRCDRFDLFDHFGPLLAADHF